jgi:hypothetical protein
MAAPRKAPVRSRPESFLVRCTPDELAEIDAAIAKVQAGLPGGASINRQGFVLDAALARARAVPKPGTR